jgi:hypothetical protein
MKKRENQCGILCSFRWSTCRQRSTYLRQSSCPTFFCKIRRAPTRATHKLMLREPRCFSPSGGPECTDRRIFCACPASVQGKDTRTMQSAFAVEAALMARLVRANYAMPSGHQRPIGPQPARLRPGQARPGQARAQARLKPGGQARPGQVSQARSGQARPGQARPGQVRLQARPGQVRPGQARPGQAEARPGQAQARSGSGQARLQARLRSGQASQARSGQASGQARLSFRPK